MRGEEKLVEGEPCESRKNMKKGQLNSEAKCFMI